MVIAKFTDHCFKEVLRCFIRGKKGKLSKDLNRLKVSVEDIDVSLVLFRVASV